MRSGDRSCHRVRALLRRTGTRVSAVWSGRLFGHAPGDDAQRCASAVHGSSDRARDSSGKRATPGFRLCEGGDTCRAPHPRSIGAFCERRTGDPRAARGAVCRLAALVHARHASPMTSVRTLAVVVALTAHARAESPASSEKTAAWHRDGRSPSRSTTRRAPTSASGRAWW